jgi:hypothetical protein
MSASFQDLFAAQYPVVPERRKWTGLRGIME